MANTFSPGPQLVSRQRTRTQHKRSW